MLRVDALGRIVALYGSTGTALSRIAREHDPACRNQVYSVKRAFSAAIGDNIGRIIDSNQEASIMIRCIAIILGLCVLSIPHAARAEAGWTDHASVIELIPTARHYYEVHLEVGSNPSGCRDKSWFYLNYDTPGASEMFDLFVESIKSRMRLRVYVTGVCNLNGYSEISAVGAGPIGR